MNEYSKFKVYCKELERHKRIHKGKASNHSNSVPLSVSASEIMEHDVSKRTDREKLRVQLKEFMVNEDATLTEEQIKSLVYKIYPKLVLTRIEASDSVAFAALNNAAAIISDANMGVVHTSICFNGCLIEWNNSSLVSIRKAEGSTIILAAGLKHRGKSYLEIPILAYNKWLDKVCKTNKQSFVDILSRLLI